MLRMYNVTQGDGGGGGCFQTGWPGAGGGVLPREGNIQAETSVTRGSQPWPRERASKAEGTAGAKTLRQE